MPPTNPAPLSQRLCDRMARDGLSCREVAQLTGVNFMTVNRFNR